MRIVPPLTPATWLFLLGAAVEGCLLMFHRLPVENAVQDTIILYIVISLFYLIAVRIVLGDPLARNARVVIGGWAILFRITAWPLEAPLSDDIYRYRWEGKLQANGGNPYQARPDDAQWQSLRDETWPKVGSKDVKAGYGPVTELMELGMYRLAEVLTADPYRQAHWFKLPSALFDLGAMAALWFLLAAKGLAGERILIYAWAPAAVLEFWGTGHNDSAMICLMLLALLGAARGRWSWAFLALGLAAGAKLWPLILLPAFVWQKRDWQWLLSLGVCAAAAIPYWSDVSANARFMSGFLGGWRNNDSLFGVLLWLTGDEYRAKYLAFGLLAMAVISITVTSWQLEQKVLATIVALLTVSANVHPWYLTWFLPLMAFNPALPLFLWLSLSPLFYVVLIEWHAHSKWEGSTRIRWWVYIPVAASALSIAIQKRLR